MWAEQTDDLQVYESDESPLKSAGILINPDYPFRRL